MTDDGRLWDHSQAKQRAADWLDRRWTYDRTCPICRSNNWSIGDVVELRPYTGGPLNLGAGIYPLVIINCDVCGYSWLMNALVSGAIDDPSAPNT